MTKPPPNPHPADVLRIPKPSWHRKGEPLPPFDMVASHMTAQGKAWTEQDDAAWRASIEATKSKRKAVQPFATSTAALPAATPAADPAPPQAVPRHRRAKPEKVDMEVMSVRVWTGLNRRMDKYLAEHGVSKQAVVSDVLDAFLTEQGF